MGDDKRAVNTEGSLRNGISQPRVGVGALLVDQLAVGTRSRQLTSIPTTTTRFFPFAFRSSLLVPETIGRAWSSPT